MLFNIVVGAAALALVGMMVATLGAVLLVSVHELRIARRLDANAGAERDDERIVRGAVANSMGKP